MYKRQELKRANRKMSEYGLQLREKQKAKFIYGVLEKPFRKMCIRDRASTLLKSETREDLSRIRAKVSNMLMKLSDVKLVRLVRNNLRSCLLYTSRCV